MWEKKHKDYDRKQVLRKLEQSNSPKTEEDVKKRWHNLRSSALRYTKKASTGDGEIKWPYWNDMAFLREYFAAEEEEESVWSVKETALCAKFVTYASISVRLRGGVDCNEMCQITTHLGEKYTHLC